MPVYVDNLQSWGWKMYGRMVPSCHMIADTPEELHTAAVAVGLKTRYAQRSGLGDLHYDLTPTRRAKVVAQGALELDRAEFVKKLRELRGAQ
jgi:hypothetical protein